MDLSDVLASGNCAGCGACVLTGAADRMALDDAGDLRPVLGSARPDVTDFGGVALESYCPALVVHRPSASGRATVDRDFGRWLGVWSAHAMDPTIRWVGSSGGALTALSAQLLDEGSPMGVVMARGEAGSARSEAFVARSVADLQQGASSRYAPVSTLAKLGDRSELGHLAVVARPCEASALRALVGEGDQAPTIVSFFCAGVPGQAATDQLIERLGCDAEQVQAVRYRGKGWPGNFVAVPRDGTPFEATYEESWGEVLGRNLQSRCKICVDGVGESADVVAGDLWEADENGYPTFTEADGQSILIARTARGLALVDRAVRGGHLAADPTDLEATRLVQAMQVNRRRHLLGRLAGRRLAGLVNPTFRGFKLWRQALRDPRGNVRQARGSFRRVRAK